MRGVVEKLLNVLLVVILLLFVLSVIGKKLGWNSFVVLSGSMEPNVPVGSLVVAGPLGTKSLQVGDVLTYRSGSNQGPIVTHRIVSIDKDSGAFQTKGDSNQYPDEQWVKQEQIIGKVRFHLPYLGYGVYGLRSRMGIFFSLGILLIYALVSIYKGFFKSNTVRGEHVKSLDKGDG